MSDYFAAKARQRGDSWRVKTLSVMKKMGMTREEARNHELFKLLKDHWNVKHN